MELVFLVNAGEKWNNCKYSYLQEAVSNPVYLMNT